MGRSRQRMAIIQEEPSAAYASQAQTGTRRILNRFRSWKRFNMRRVPVSQPGDCICGTRLLLIMAILWRDVPFIALLFVSTR